jgi:hypothetical protein
MQDAFVCRIAPRIVKNGRPRGTLIDPTVAVVGGNTNQDFREYYDQTVGQSKLPTVMYLEFGQPPQDDGQPAIKNGDIIIFLVGSDDIDGGTNERGISGIGRVASIQISGAGVAARCVVSVTVLVQLRKICSNHDIQRSPFMVDSGIESIGVFGLQGAPQAHNCVRFFDKNDTTEKRQDRLAGVLGLLDRFDSSFRQALMLADQSLAQLIPNTPQANTPKVNLDNLINEFQTIATGSRLVTNTAFVGRLCASLLTKRFLILTGLSGSGKTKLAHAFAAWIAETDEQYRVIAVGADWTTNENLLGYQDALRPEIYRKPTNGALDLMLRARDDAERPYFLILDEMNLSHVERYFADMLSAIESGEPIALHSATEDLPGGDGDTLHVPSRLSLPKNLFIIGTVNVDETTYMFSPKVLDRANVIEFRATAEQIESFLDDPQPIRMDALAHKGASYGAAFVVAASGAAPVLADLPATIHPNGAQCAADLKARMVEAFKALSPIGAEFGFRTALEIARFVAFHATLTGAGWQFSAALDAQVYQKLLPKLHGSERRLGPVLKALGEFCTLHGCTASLEKIKRMQDRLKDGFTSFAEA